MKLLQHLTAMSIIALFLAFIQVLVMFLLAVFPIELVGIAWLLGVLGLSMLYTKLGQ